MSNAEFPSPLVAVESLVARTQAIGVEVDAVYDEVQALALRLEVAITPLLPEGTTADDSFVVAVIDAVEHELVPTPNDGLEDAVALLVSDDPQDRSLLLEDVWFTAKHQANYAKRVQELMAAVAKSLEGFLIHSQREAAEVVTGESSAGHQTTSSISLDDTPSITKEVEDADRIRIQCQMLQEAADEAATMALRGLTQLRWDQASAVIGDERLRELWCDIAQGRMRLADVSDDDLPPAVGKALRLFVEDTAGYLSQEIMQAKQSAPVDDFDDDVDVEVDEDVEIIPPRFVVKVAHPDPVQKGDVFALQIVARNDHLVPVVLDTVDIELSLLNGFDVLSIDPPPADQRQESDELTLAYESAVPPAGAALVVMTLRAKVEGNFAGEVRVWTDEIEDAVAMPNIDVLGTVQ